MSDRTVRLVGGPADGQTLTNYRGGPVLVHSDEQADMVARYRPTRNPDVLRFCEWDRVVASIPMGQSSERPADTPARDAGDAETHGRQRPS